jgi:Putative adhesin
VLGVRSEAFETPGDVRLNVRLGSGEIRLETSDVSQTTVRLEPLRDNEATQLAIEEARIELRQRGQGHEVLVDVRGRKGFAFGRGVDVLVEIQSPDGTDVVAKTGSADVEGRGNFGDVEVESGSGDVQFSEVGDADISAASGDIQIGSIGGDANINSASGDIQLASIGHDGKVNSASGDVQIREARGSLSVNSASGDVLIREVGSSVSVNTASGDQTIGAVTEGSVGLKSASGDLKIGIREGSTLWVDARSRSGEVSSELPVTDLPPEGDAPHVELRANTMSGDINLVRA